MGVGFRKPAVNEFISWRQTEKDDHYLSHYSLHSFLSTENHNFYIIECERRKITNEYLREVRGVPLGIWAVIQVTHKI